MALPVTKFETNEGAARAVLNYVQAIRSGLCIRPFNHYQPEFSRWWLIPGTDWPACRYSKFSIRRSPQGEMCVGFYAEKGLDESLATMPGVHPSQIMQNDWYWHHFLREARSGVLDGVAENVVSCSGCAVRLMIEIYAFNRVPIPGVTVSVDEYVELKLEPSTRTFMAEAPGLNTLVQFNNCSSIRDVAERLQTDRGLQFFWVDLHIEIHLAYGSETSGSWGAPEIWENSLAPGRSWVE